MGVNCDSSAIYVAVVENGTVLDGHAERIQVPAGLPSEGRLVAVFDDAGRVMEEIKPDRIALLRPEATYSATHEQFTPRVTLEALLRLAAALQDVPLDRVSRQALRAGLSLPKKGKLDQMLGSVFDAPVGGYWKNGRGLAAMAALGLENR